MGWTPLSERLKSTVFSQVDCHRSISNGTSFTRFPSRHWRRAVNTFGEQSTRTRTAGWEAVERTPTAGRGLTQKKVNKPNEGNNRNQADPPGGPRKEKFRGGPRPAPAPTKYPLRI